MATLEVCSDPRLVYGGCGAVDRFDANVGVAQGGDLVVH